MKASQPVFIPDFTEELVLMHADHYLERMAIESRPSNGAGMMHEAVITEEDPEIQNLAGWKAQANPYFWSRWKQKYWLAPRVFASMLPSVIKSMMAEPGEGKMEGIEPQANVFMLKTSWDEVPTGGPRASG